MKRDSKGRFLRNRGSHSLARRNPPETGARRLPGLLAALPPMRTLAFSGLGFLLPPFIEGMAPRFVPIRGRGGAWILKIGTVLVTIWGTAQFVGRAEARDAALGGGTYLVTSAISEFLPQLVGPRPAPAPTPTARMYYEEPFGLGSQPALDVLNDTADRLDPSRLY